MNITITRNIGDVSEILEIENIDDTSPLEIIKSVIDYFNHELNLKDK